MLELLCVAFSMLSKLRDLYLLLAAKVRRRWKEERGPEAQRQRPEQQHQPHSSSCLIRSRRLLKASLPVLFTSPSAVTPPSVFILQLTTDTDVSERLSSSLLAFFTQSYGLFSFFFTQKDAKRNAHLAILISFVLVLIDIGIVLEVSPFKNFSPPPLVPSGELLYCS